MSAGALATQSIDVGVAVGVLPLLTFAVAVAIIAELQFVFYRTAPEPAFRAVSDNQDVAQLMGLDRRHVFGLAMALSLAVRGVAGWHILAGHVAFLVVIAVRPRGLFPRMS